MSSEKYENPSGSGDHLDCVSSEKYRLEVEVDVVQIIPIFLHQLLLKKIDVAVSNVSQDTKESITTEIDSQINYEREKIKQLKDEKADLMDRRDALLDGIGQDRDVCDKDKTPQAKNSAKRKLGSTS